VLLFIDRLPLHSWMDDGHRVSVRRRSASLPAIATLPVVSAPPIGRHPQRWVLDTAFTGDAYAWRPHLLEVGLDPRASLAGTTAVLSAFGQRESLTVCKASVWLLSNIPALQDTPFRLALSPGILFRDATPSDPEFHRPLLGMRALLRAGVRVQIDFARATVSVWVPGSWSRCLAVSLRRSLTGFRTLPVHW
jgi:hypothetical protein